MLPRPHSLVLAEDCSPDVSSDKDSPIDDGEYIGEYMGGENITADEFQRYMFDLNPDRQAAYMISF